jgi:uncharacterized protein with GYD domain
VDVFTYVGLIQLAPEGRQNPDRRLDYLAAIRRIVEEEGGVLEHVLPMIGPWDFFSIVKYRDDEAALRVITRLELLDVVKAETFTQLSTKPGLWRLHEAVQVPEPTSVWAAPT